MQNDNYLYNWFFHFNPHMNRYFAFHREDFTAYLNGTPTKYPVIKATTLSTLEKILISYKGDPSKLFEDAKDRSTNISSL